MGSLFKKFLFPLSFLTILQIHATPVPQRIIGAKLSSDQICSLTFTPQNWTLSGAGFMIDNFVDQNGAKDWLNKLDQMTTVGGQVATSPLQCTNIEGNGCPPPSINCLAFTPAQYYLVRNAVFSCWNQLKIFKAELVDAVIIASLGTSRIVTDFGEPKMEDTDIFGIISGAFSIASGITAAFPELSGPFGVLSGIASILGALPDDGTPAPDLQGDIDERLQQAFVATRDGIDKLTSVIFGGTSDTSSLKLLAPAEIANGEVTDIGRFFSGGRYLIDARWDPQPIIRNLVSNGISRIRQALVARALKSTGHIVFVDTGVLRPEDCNTTGSRWVVGQCLKLSRSTRDGVFTDVDPNLALKLDKAPYNINLPEFYLNAFQCPAAKALNGGQISSLGLPLDGTLPPCFFDLDVQAGLPCFVCDSASCGSDYVIRDVCRG
ncbi:hypothetical protein TWF694_007565 [Orbilia ellipsospora]|uniref:Uncharacterized protein n=1 Tax=Orbilia ellipsospora TaxID=2528407 RepID=A0AAV9XJL8_9PEZI